MIHGIQMTEQSMETKIAVLEAKVEHMMIHTKELTLRVRANEKVVASVSLLGVIACTFIGAGYFAPKADAEVRGDLFSESVFDVAHMGHSFPTGEWIQKIREYESKRKRISIDEMLNNTLMEYENGSDGSTESEELLQLSSNED